MHEEINVRMKATNRCYFAIENLYNSKNVKEKLYTNYIKPLTYTTDVCIYHVVYD